MSGLAEIIARLDDINRAVAGYDTVLKEAACDILLARAFPPETKFATEPGPRRESSVRLRRRSARHATLAALLRRWAPRKAREQALLAVYFLTRESTEGGISTRAVTTLLRENGILLSAPTTALLANTTRTPALLSATKAGASKQARQTFQITPAGETYVRSQLGEEG
jgi:hypothetical protein